MFAELSQTWLTEIVANAEARDDFDSECRANGVLGGADAEMQGRYEQAVRCPITPFLVDFQAFLQKGLGGRFR